MLDDVISHVTFSSNQEESYYIMESGAVEAIWSRRTGPANHIVVQ